MTKGLIAWFGCIGVAALHAAFGRDPSAYLAASIVIGLLISERK